MEQRDIKKRVPTPWKGSAGLFILLFLLMTAAGIVATLSLPTSKTPTMTSTSRHQHRRLSELQRIPVYSPANDTPIARKQLNDMHQILDSDTVYFESMPLTVDQQRYFLQQDCGDAAADRFDEFLQLQQHHFAVEVFKWCALGKNDDQVSVYFDTTSPLLMRLHDIVVNDDDGMMKSLVVLADAQHFPHAMTGSFVLLMPHHSSVAKEMLRVLIETPLDALEVTPLLIPHTLYSLVAKQGDKANTEEQPRKPTLQPDLYGRDWNILQQTCSTMNPLRRVPSSTPDDDSLLHHCPKIKGFCCSVHDTTRRHTVLMTQYPILPVQRLPQLLPQPYNSATGQFSQDELPYIATVHEENTDDLQQQHSPNFYDTLPTDCVDDNCSKCLRDKKGATCESCAEACPCFCERLCREPPKPKPVVKTLHVTPPAFSRDPNRLVPRIVHQTWFEELNDITKYPNMVSKQEQDSNCHSLRRAVNLDSRSSAHESL
jgi:hypothetical protein